LYQSLYKIAAERFTAFLFEPLMASELDARAALGLDTIDPGTFKVISAVLNVCAKLLLQVILGLRTMKKPRR
jgi:hypothetical protein